MTCKIRKWELTDEEETFAFAITVDNRVVGSIGAFRQGNIHRQTDVFAAERGDVAHVLPQRLTL